MQKLGLEQYLFDEEIKHLISFSDMIKNNSQNDIITPIGYYCKTNTSGNIQDATNEINCKVIAENEVTNFRKEYTIQLTNNQEFLDKLKLIYPNGNQENGIKYDEQVEVIKKDENGNPVKVNGVDQKEKKGRYLFVKWGIEECKSNGLFVENSTGRKNKDFIVNDNDYIIVGYDLYEGSVKVAYSKGYKADDTIIYTLDDMLYYNENAEVKEAEVKE